MLSLAPSIMVMVTSFTRIVVVLSFLRSALGVQQTPPIAVLISLAPFLTAFVMTPTLEKSYREGLVPLIENKISEKTALELSIAPIRSFMMAHIRSQDLKLFMDISDTPAVDGPAIMIRELRRAFEIEFLLFLPFVIIDMVVASLLMSMGMMMLRPVIISLPFKLIFFVLVNGWYLVAGSLDQSDAGG